MKAHHLTFIAPGTLGRETDEIMGPSKLFLVFLELAILGSFPGFGSCDSPLRMCDADNESSEQCEDYDIEEPLYLLYNDVMNPDNGVPLSMDEITLEKAQPHNNSVWKVLIHGFLNNANSTFPDNVKRAYLERTKRTGMKYNVLVVDWGKAACASLSNAQQYLYNYAAHNVAHVGRKLGDFLVYLHEHNFANISENVHILGFSLGAHVAGGAGSRIFDKLGITVRRISGLDPAGPAFWAWQFVPTFLLPRKRLHRMDAQFADIYHTSSLFGSSKKMGDIDFWINGGESQPSCVPRPFNYFVRDFTQVCSHNFVTQMYAKTINDNSMRGCACPSYSSYKLGICRCQDYAVLGEFVDNCDGSHCPKANVDSSVTMGEYFIDPPSEDFSIQDIIGNFWKMSFKDKFKKWWEILC